MSTPLALADDRTVWSMSLVLKKLRKYLLVVETSLQSNMAYAVNFVADTAFYAVICFVLMSLWRTVYAGGQPIPDYSGTQMMCILHHHRDGVHVSLRRLWRTHKGSAER